MTANVEEAIAVALEGVLHELRLANRLRVIDLQVRLGEMARSDGGGLPPRDLWNEVMEVRWLIGWQDRE